MATSDRRGVLLRSLPVLVLLTLVLAAVPQRSTSPPRATAGSAASASAVPTSSTPEDPATEAAATDDPPADHVTVLAAQSTASARGCRAPPVASV
jgi:hypothetical protein